MTTPTHVNELPSGYDDRDGQPILIGQISAAMVAADVHEIAWRFPGACNWCGSLAPHVMGICD